MATVPKTAFTRASEMPVLGIPPPSYRLPASARVGRVRLAVSDLGSSIRFYRDVIGLAVVDQKGLIAQLGVGQTSTVLLELEEVPGVEPLGKRKRLGLYHTALLLPSREALSSFIGHLESNGIPFGAADHLYSEALYLTDPDSLGVEVYADRPRSAWITDENELLSGVEALRLDELRENDSPPWKGAPTGTTLGHLHFYIGDLNRASNFYHNGLGLTIMTWRYPGALFTSAGGYHHHVGLNVWAAKSPEATPTDARLLFWEMLFPDANSLHLALASLIAAGYESVGRTDDPMFTDPWGITVALRVDSTQGMEGEDLGRS